MPALEPTAVQDGLAVYVRGQGPPVLLFPYPHGSTVEPMAQGEIADVLVDIGRTVVTFDPPGAYASTRHPVGDLDEMVSCGAEALAFASTLGIESCVAVAGHSMGGLCALGFALEYPEAVNRLLLLNAAAGFPAVRRWGIHKHWAFWQREWWEIRYLGVKTMLGLTSQYDHDRLDWLNNRASFVDATLAGRPPAKPDRRNRASASAPVRDLWLSHVRKIDLVPRLGEVVSPTLVTTSVFDPQTPPPMCREIHEGITGSTYVEFQMSGHCPYLEEPGRFRDVVAGFLQ